MGVDFGQQCVLDIVDMFGVQCMVVVVVQLVIDWLCQYCYVGGDQCCYDGGIKDVVLIFQYGLFEFDDYVIDFQVFIWCGIDGFYYCFVFGVQDVFYFYCFDCGQCLIFLYFVVWCYVDVYDQFWYWIQQEF